MSAEAHMAGDVVERLVAAYNAQDLEAMAELLAPELDFGRFNGAVSFRSSAELIAAFRGFANEYMPDRTRGRPLRTVVSDNIVYREQMWTGTLAADVPGSGTAGDKVSERLCSVFKVEDGRIVEYYDYG